MTRLRTVPLLAATALAAGLLAPTSAPALTGATSAAAERRTPRLVDLQQFDTTADLAAGTTSGVRVRRGRLTLSTPTGTVRYRDAVGRARYEKGAWLSPWREPGFTATEVIPSWQARTPAGTFVRVDARVRAASGAVGSWDTVARWASGDDTIARASGPAQSDDLASLATDTVRAPGGAAAWQVRVTLHRRVGLRVTPRVGSVAVMASRVSDVSSVPTSTPIATGLGVELPVPRFSQMVHRGHYPQWGGGGQAWCSPTAISMVLAFWDSLPRPAEFAWAAGTDPWIDHAARSTYDYAYEGAGNWAFGTAFAGRYVDSAVVTRLASLNEAQQHVARGVPVVASIAFGAGELTGAPINSSAGHLLVIRGFTADGDVIVNDSAAPRNRSVRRVYDRGEFENAWLPASGGVVYLIEARQD